MNKAIRVHFSRNARKTAVALLGRIVPAEQLAYLAGALDGAVVQVSAHGESLFFDVQHPEILFQQRRLAKDELGRLYVRNLYFEKQPWGKPLMGLRALMRQIEAGQVLGISYLSLSAIGEADSDGFNGYYTWARYGFDAELPLDVQARLPEEYAGVKTLNELFQQGGAEVWQRRGVPMELAFALTPGSSMMQTLNAYLAQLKKEGRWS